VELTLEPLDAPMGVRDTAAAVEEFNQKQGRGGEN
jgi:hypothetical protein